MPRPNGSDRVAARKARLERHAEETDPEIVLNAAARFLEARQRSVHEVRRHLAEARYPAELIDRAIERLLELHWLDDEIFARTWVESRDRAHPRGHQALRRELALKGVDRSVIEVVLEARDDEPVDDLPLDETDGEADEGGSADERAATRLLEKKWSTLSRVADPQVRRQRAYALLARNGFDAGVCRDVSGRMARRLDPLVSDEDE